MCTPTDRRRCRPAPLLQAADHSATSRALPPTGPVAVIVASLQTKPNSSGSVDGSPAGSSARSKVMTPFGERAGLVGEQHLDVAQVFDGHQPLDQHPLASERARAGREADAHDGGQQLGVMPMAMASENSNASSNGREKATLITKIEIVSTAATRTSSLEKPRSPT